MTICRCVAAAVLLFKSPSWGNSSVFWQKLLGLFYSFGFFGPQEEDPVLTMQKTGLVWKRLSPMDVITMDGSVNNHFPVLGHFRHGDNNQLGDPRASLLLTSEKVVFCNTLSMDYTGKPSNIKIFWGPKYNGVLGCWCFSRFIALYYV